MESGNGFKGLAFLRYRRSWYNPTTSQPSFAEIPTISTANAIVSHETNDASEVELEDRPVTIAMDCCHGWIRGSAKQTNNTAW